LTGFQQGGRFWENGEKEGRNRNMPHHSFGAYSNTSKGKGHPLMFGFPKEVEMLGDFPEGGGYPKGFLSWAFEKMGVTKPCDVLHLCSGSVKVGVRLDLRLSTRPSVVADCAATPFKAESFAFILADPPYSKEYARNLYQTESAYPQPYSIVMEACRILRPGGLLGLLHFQVPYFRKPMRLLGVWGVTQGIGYNIRAWSLLQKQP
jgi:hypothetical protein